MPELPDIALYRQALAARITGAKLERIVIAHPFALRTVAPRPAEIEGRAVRQVRRVGKRIAIGLAGDAWMVIHLMIAGRLHWHDAPVLPKARRDLAVFRFSSGCLRLMEAGAKRRASLHLLEGRDAWAAHDPGGLEVLDCAAEDFAGRLRAHNRTLKRALTDPRILSGIGNAYSDEILHRARLSPVAMTRALDDAEMARLHAACRTVLACWSAELARRAGDGWPDKVTAFVDGMAVHGRYGKPCPDCGAAIQRIRHATSETNYCPRCQTGGKLLADRSLSRLLKADWPATIEELEGAR